MTYIIARRYTLNQASHYVKDEGYLGAETVSESVTEQKKYEHE